MAHGTARILAVLLLAAGPLVGYADGAPVAATWQVHEYQFSFAGVTSRYSCDGLVTVLKGLLRLAGARPGFQVTESCAATGPQAIALARMRFETLAAAPPAASAVQTVGAWREVVLKGDGARDVAGDCEVIEQFAREVLPMFTTRNVANRMHCAPYDETLGNGIDLAFTVLAPGPGPQSSPR